MTAELVLIIKATLILGAALAATRLAHHTRASLRALILSSAFGLMLVLPIASAVTPAREVLIPAAVTPAFLVEEWASEQPEILGVRPQSTAHAVTSTWELPSLRTVSRGMWLLGTVIALLPLALGLWRVHNLRRRGLAWPAGSAFADQLRVSLGLRRAVTVILHRGVVTPVTCGWVRPTVMMPIDARDWTSADVRQALLHELEHVRRHDWPVHILARLTCAIYWFHPAAWIAWRQLSLDSERACDDAVVLQAENTAYAQQLISLARRASTGNAEPLLSMADRRTLATRVASILSTTVARGRVGFVPVATVLVIALALSAVLFPLQARARAQSARNTVDPGLRFGVASVRPNDGSDPSRGFGFTLESGRLRLRNQTLRTLVSIAYAPTFGLWFPDERISGGPAWMTSERFTIEARAERAVTGREMGAMLRTLLAERFGLKVRIELRSAPIYSLVVVKRDRSLGPALKRTANECTGRCGIGGGPGRYQLAGASMALLAGSLSEMVGRPVADRTDLTGTFDGTLEWTPTPEEFGALGEPAPAASTFGASLFTALEEQFGLKLQSERGEVEYLVVESADQPTPNEAPEREAGTQNVSAGPPPPPRPELSFDIVSVRPNTGSDTSIPFGPTPPDGINLVNRPLESLVRQAYEIQFFRVINMPAWANQERFDITAKAGRPITDAERRLMLRRLLADRFGLTVHFEAREQTVYVMTRARSDGALGPGLKARPECPAAADKCVSAGSAIVPAGRLSLKAVTFDVLASGLMSAVLEGLVLNESKVDGHFDVELSWRPEGATADAADSRASFSTSIEEQLGMKLTAQRRPVQVLVIERIDRPTRN